MGSAKTIRRKPVAFVMALISQPRNQILEAIDFNPYKWKISKKYPMISHEEFEIIENEYRRYLLLKIMYPSERFAPTRNTDQMWHQHILDTANYRRHCNELFGKFIDHRPYFGPYSTDGVWESMSNQFDRMHEIYNLVFGEAPAPDLEVFIDKENRRSFCNSDTGETCDAGDGCGDDG